MKLIGRIKYETKGAYDPATSYRAMDVVLYSGSLWEALKDTAGNPPPENQRNEDGSPASNEFWRLFLPGALGDDYVKKTDIAKAPTETEQGKVGVVMPDGKTIQIDENGLLTGTPLDFMGTWKELQEGLASGEITEGMIGYIEGTPDNPEDPDHPNNILIHIDDYLSLVSSNAVQNRIITEALNQIKELAEQNAQIIEETKALRASIEAFGLSKVCPVETTDVTETDSGLVLGAFEKNASVAGTLANLISVVSSGFSEYMKKENNSFRSLGTIEESQANNIIGYLGINGTWQTARYQGTFHANGKNYGVLGLDCSDALGDRTSTGVQIAITSHAELLKRKCTNGTWSAWENL